MPLRAAPNGTGGNGSAIQGFFYAPSVISEVPLDAEIMNEEPFGPVAIINPFAREEDMIARANRLPYGLAAYSWTNDVKRQRRLMREVETGMLGVNTTMKSVEPMLPLAASNGRAMAMKTALKACMPASSPRRSMKDDVIDPRGISVAASMRRLGLGLRHRCCLMRASPEPEKSAMTHELKTGGDRGYLRIAA